MTEVAAAILRRSGRILICQRKEGGNCSLLWEFPGGKREAGESMEQCAVRECQEELGLTVAIRELLEEKSYTYGSKPFSFAFYRADIVGGTLEMRVHRAVEWVRPADLLRYPFCPADAELVRRLAGEAPLLESVHHAAVIVSDYEKSKAFYVDTLGLEIIRENYRAERDSYKLDLRLGDCELEIFSFPGSPERPTRPEACGLRHLAFRVADIRRTAEALEGRGVAVEPIRMDEYTGEAYTFFMDPDGLPLEMKQRAQDTGNAQN